MKRTRVMKLSVFCLALALVAAFLLASCAEPAPAPAPAPAPTPAPAPAPTPAPPVEKPVELKYATAIPPVSFMNTDIIIPWIEEVESLSGGKVKITPYWAESLVKAPDMYSALLAKTADIIEMDPSWTPGVFLLSEGISLPLVFDSAEAASATYYELIEKHLQAGEFKDIKVLSCRAIGAANFSTKTKQIKVLEDLSGQKIATTAGGGVKTLQQLGAAPTLLPIVDVFTALERGMVDGYVDCWDAAECFKFYEVTKYRTNVGGLLHPRIVLLMNKDSYNSLPSDIKQIFDQTTGLEQSRSGGALVDANEKVVLSRILEYDKEKGNPEIYNLPQAERERWREAVAPVYEDWIAENEAKGLPARAFFEDLLQIAAKYNK